MSENSSAAAQAYIAVKKRILDQTYPPGKKLSEARLVEDLSLGRSRIRSALAQLKNDGWISVSPQSGTYVRSLSEKEIEDLLDLRLLLEVHVMQAAVANISAGDLRKLRRALDTFFPRGGTKPDFDDFNEFDSLFHLTIYRVAGNSLITDILLNLVEKVQWLKTSVLTTPERIKSGFRELEHILEALEARDPKKAALLMREHICNAADYSAGTRGKPSREEKK